MRMMGWFSLLYLLFAFFLVDMRIRYIGPILPPLVILAVIGIGDVVDYCRLRFSGPLRTLAFTALWVFGLGLVGLNGAYLAKQFQEIAPLSYLDGRLSRDEYIQKYRPEYAAICYANRHLPAKARILVLFNGNRIYYSDREMVCSTELFRSMLSHNQSAETVRDELIRRGISHLLVGTQIFNRWADSQFDDREKLILQGLFRWYLKSLHLSHGYALLQVVEE
jgi:hypothetical protein